ncbi:MAG: hypothetical protein WC734_06000 [Patescibacteria group bacterium]|jgi:hypothetical protein
MKTETLRKAQRELDGLNSVQLGMALGMTDKKKDALLYNQILIALAKKFRGADNA